MTEIIRVRPWSDPVIDTLGHEPRSAYVERFWLPTLGPTTLLLLRHVAARLDEHPAGADLPVLETSLALGLGAREGQSSPLRRSFSRLVQFDLACADPAGSMAVRRNVPPINRRHARRLPAALQRAHEAWCSARLAEPPMEAVRRKARLVAVTLVELGEDVEGVERALCTAGFHPAVCRESATWAHERAG